jgi:ligand-binding sensor domain-containing protein
VWEFTPGGPPGEIQGFRKYGPANGLSDQVIYALRQDRDGNLWLGSETGGAMKIARGGIRTYTESDGLRSARFGSLFENRTGEFLAITGPQEAKFLQRFDGKTFNSIPLRPNGISKLGSGSKQIGFEDHPGEWWLATGQGLCRFPRIARFEQLQYARLKTIYTTRDGLAAILFT